MAVVSVATLGVSLCWLGLDVTLTKRLLGGWVVPTWAWREIRPMFHFSMWENAQAIGIYATTTADKLILTSFLGSGGLPFYAIAQRLFGQIHSAMAQQFSFMFPLLAADARDVFEVVGRIEDRARWFLAAIGALLYAGLFQVGVEILGLVVSPGFAERARWPVYLVCVQGMFFAFGIANFFLLYAVGDGSRNALFNVAERAWCLLLTWYWSRTMVTWARVSRNFCRGFGFAVCDGVAQNSEDPGARAGLFERLSVAPLLVPRFGYRLGAHEGLGGPVTRGVCARDNRKCGHRGGLPGDRGADVLPTAAAAGDGLRCGMYRDSEF